MGGERAECEVRFRRSKLRCVHPISNQRDNVSVLCQGPCKKMIVYRQENGEIK